MMRTGFSLVIVALLGSLVAALPPGFVDEEVIRVSDGTGAIFAWNQITDAPMMLVAKKIGQVWAVEDPDARKPSKKMILDMANTTCSNGERGLQGIAAHPNFQENHWLYLFYSAKPENETECFLEDAVRGPRNVVSRVKVGSDNMVNTSTEEILLTTVPLEDYNHNGGALLFGVDGHLYVTLGDGGSHADAYSQKQNMLLGKVLRITDDGDIPEDNPYLGANSARCNMGENLGPYDVCQEIHSIGLRNPFRFAMDMNSKDEVRFLVSDVGANIWEELDEGGMGYNYGWPVREGPCRLSSLDDCETTEGVFEDPLYWYVHTEEGGCVVGGTFIPEEAGWPEEFDNGFLFADFVFGTISLLTKTDDGCRHCVPPVPEWSNSTFHEWPRPVDLLFGPYKDETVLYYTARQGSKNIRRIRYLGGDNSAPVAVIVNTVTSGKAPLEVEFNATESSDPDGDPITYEWDFGDVAEASSDGSAVVTFKDIGVYTVSLTVSDNSSTTNTVSVEIQVGEPPVAIIDSPAENSTFAVGEIFFVEGRALDEKGGDLKNFEMFWEVRQHHNSHYHPYMGRTAGNSFALPPAPEPEDFLAATNSFIEILLYVYDEDGLSTVTSRKLMPKTTPVLLDSSPTGLELWVDDFPIKTPATVITWANHRLTMEARDQDGSTFINWSDGGLSRHPVHITDGNTLWWFVAMFEERFPEPTDAPNTPAPVGIPGSVSPTIPWGLGWDTDAPVAPAAPDATQPSVGAVSRGDIASAADRLCTSSLSILSVLAFCQILL